ncbi:flagellin [Kordiimonas aestuarii]|uniref:flagellin n=1 Tax=Kordiimonas aestuarii TaxID=1005925 RepID=UPI0021D2C669|nr:flagellin [Kordiimonas aestuarii]
MFSVNTNAGAFAALQNLNATGRSLETTQSRVNTGLKVASARDDAATYSIAQNMRGDVAGFRAVGNSLSRAQSELDVAIAGAEAISDLLIQMKEKAVAAKDDGIDDASKDALNADYQQLMEQITSISENATFNGKNLLTGDTLSAITDSTGTSGGTITSSGNTLTTSSLGLADTSIGAGGGSYTFNSVGSSITGFSFKAYIQGNNFPEAYSTIFNEIFEAEGWISSGQDVVTDLIDAGVDPASVDSTLLQWFNSGDTGWTIQNSINIGTIAETGEYAIQGGDVLAAGPGGGDPDAAVDAVEAAISTVNDVLSNLGSTSNRLAIQQQFAGRLSDSLDVGIGNLVDADMARESANLQAFQTKQQLGLQALGIANQSPQSVLSLFR